MDESVIGSAHRNRARTTHGIEALMTQGRGRLPDRLSQAVTDLIALRGWARVRGDAQLAEAWERIAGASVASGTRVVGIRRGVLQVAVGNSPLLSELAAYRKDTLLEAFSRDHPELKIRDLKFVMRGNLSPRAPTNPRPS